MDMSFDFENITNTELGVGLEVGEEEEYLIVAVDAEVQTALREMLIATVERLDSLESESQEYDPSEKYGSTEHLRLPLSSEFAQGLRPLQEAENIRIDSASLDNPSNIFMYFARYTDKSGRRLTAVRRSSQFKAMLKRRLVQLLSDAVRLFKEPIFVLDPDFDLLIDSSTIHALRPTALESLAGLKEAVLAAVDSNVDKLESALPLLDWGEVRSYASKHPRAARNLAGICSNKRADDIQISLLKQACERVGLELEEMNGKFLISQQQVATFLEVLDRRRYEVQLTSEAAERFRATGRTRVR